MHKPLYKNIRLLLGLARNKVITINLRAILYDLDELQKQLFIISRDHVFEGLRTLSSLYVESNFHSHL